MPLECPLVFACDGGYAPYLATTLRSLVESNPVSWPIECHVLADGFPDATRREVLASLPAGSVALHWIDVDLARFRAFATMTHITPITFARFLIPEVLQGRPRVLYLDADLLVLGELAPLCRAPLGGAVLGAVLDILDPKIQARSPAVERVPRVGAYFNAGVLLIDLDRWRTERISARALDYLALHPDTPYSDQDALNVVCDGHWRPLDARWNFQRDQALSRMAERPRIIHFVTGDKPWKPRSLSPNAGIYDAFRSRTRFARTPRERAADLVEHVRYRTARLRRVGVLRTIRNRIARVRPSTRDPDVAS